MEEEDFECVQLFTVAVMIPTAREEDGERIELTPKQVAKAGKELKEELNELNFGELLKALGQKVAEEQFFKFRPLVEVRSDE